MFIVQKTEYSPNGDKYQMNRRKRIQLTKKRLLHLPLNRDSPWSKRSDLATTVFMENPLKGTLRTTRKVFMSQSINLKSSTVNSLHLINPLLSVVKQTQGKRILLVHTSRIPSWCPTLKKLRNSHQIMMESYLMTCRLDIGLQKQLYTFSIKTLNDNLRSFMGPQLYQPTLRRYLLIISIIHSTKNVTLVLNKLNQLKDD